MGGWPGASGPALQAALILLWVVFTTKPAIEKEITVACRSHIQARPPQPPPLASPPSSAGPSVLSLLKTAGGPPLPAQGSSTLPCCWALHSPCRSQFESFCFLHRRPPPHPGCLPCSDSTVSRPAAILRPTLQLQSFVGRTGGLLVCLVCSMPSPPAPPIFSSVRAEVGPTLSVHSPRPGPGRQSQELWAEATQDDFPAK